MQTRKNGPPHNGIPSDVQHQPEDRRMELYLRHSTIKPLQGIPPIPLPIHQPDLLLLI